MQPSYVCGPLFLLRQNAHVPCPLKRPLVVMVPRAMPPCPAPRSCCTWRTRACGWTTARRTHCAAAWAAGWPLFRYGLRLQQPCTCLYPPPLTPFLIAVLPYALVLATICLAPLPPKFKPVQPTTQAACPTLLICPCSTYIVLRLQVAFPSFYAHAGAPGHGQDVRRRAAV